MALEADKAFLMKEGVYEHIGKIINRVIAEKPVDAHGMVEVLSRLVKDPEALARAEPTEKEVEAFAEEAKKARILDKVPLGEDGETPAESSEVPNVVADAEMCAWAGVGLGEQESYKVMCSLRNMAVKAKESGINMIRLWGKILGTNADYWIAEAKGGEPGDGDDEAVMDLPGQVGANQNIYFATTDLAGKWEQLPPIKFQELVAARLIRRLFTGDPNAKVVTHPFFNGTEKVLLRAQIARITADTVLCPVEFLKVDEDDPAADPQPNEEFVFPPASKLRVKASWMHFHKHIRKDGKTASPKQPDEDPQDEESGGKEKWAQYNEEMEDDPPRDHIRNITGDSLEWVAKQAGDTTLYLDPLDPEKKKVKSNAVTFVRSLVWPGAVTVAQKTNYTNLYIGYGLRSGDPDFFPAAPPDVQDEPRVGDRPIAGEEEEPEPIAGEEEPAAENAE